jgi:hypothetical protein
VLSSLLSNRLLVCLCIKKGISVDEIAPAQDLCFGD